MRLWLPPTPSILPPFPSSPLLLRTSPEIRSAELFKRDHLVSMYSSSYHSRAGLIGYLAYCELNTNQSIACSFYSTKQRPERNLFISTVMRLKRETKYQNLLQNSTVYIFNYIKLAFIRTPLSFWLRTHQVWLERGYELLFGIIRSSIGTSRWCVSTWCSDLSFLKTLILPETNE